LPAENGLAAEKAAGFFSVAAALRFKNVWPLCYTAGPVIKEDAFP
jgi:hypothetical protein